MIKQLLATLLLCCTTSICAQAVSKHVVASAGSFKTTSEITISYTIGETVVGKISNENSIDQGFWAGSIQVENITEQKDLDGIVVYPNPVVDELTIFTDNNELFGITLFAVDGRKVLTQTVEDTQLEHRIELSHLSKGVYVLRLLMKENPQAKMFKIIKN